MTWHEKIPHGMRKHYEVRSLSGRNVATFEGAYAESRAIDFQKDRRLLGVETAVYAVITTEIRI